MPLFSPLSCLVTPGFHYLMVHTLFHIILHHITPHHTVHARSVATNGSVTVWQPIDDASTIENTVDGSDRDRDREREKAGFGFGKLDRLIFLQNKKPKWDDTHGGHVLNFQVDTMQLTLW